LLLKVRLSGKIERGMEESKNACGIIAGQQADFISISGYWQQD
jgi:hypothetical protein